MNFWKSILCVGPLEKWQLRGDFLSDIWTLLLFTVAVYSWILLCTFPPLPPCSCGIFRGHTNSSTGATFVHEQAALCAALGCAAVLVGLEHDTWTWTEGVDPNAFRLTGRLCLMLLPLNKCWEGEVVACCCWQLSLLITFTCTCHLVPWRAKNFCLQHPSDSPTWGRLSAEDLRMELTWSTQIGTDLHTWQLSAGIWICSNKPQILGCPAKVSSRIPLRWFPVSWVLFTVLKSVVCISWYLQFSW